MTSHRGSRRKTPPSLQTLVRYRIAVIATRRLCGACLQNLLRPFFDDLNLPVFSSETEFLASVEPGERPDAVVLSSICPEAFDFKLLQRLIGALPDVSIAVHLDVSDPTIVDRLLRMGVKGILPTTLTAPVAVAALQLVAAGGLYVPPAVDFAPTPLAGRKPASGASGAKLTDRQRAVLALVADGKTNKEIARSLGLTQNTIKVHLARLMRRLGVANRVGLARIAPSVLGEKDGRGPSS